MRSALIVVTSQYQSALTDLGTLIDEVIDNQLDLVEVLVELRPLAVVKG